MSEEPEDPKFFADINKELQDKSDSEEAELLNDDFGDEDDIIAGVEEANPEMELTPDQTSKPTAELEQITGEPVLISSPEPEKEDKSELKEEILIALGFKPYNNGEQGRKYVMMLWHNAINLKLGKTFKPNGSHFWWAFPKDSDPNDPKRMLKSDAIAKIPIVHLYNEILNGTIAIPRKTLIGHVHKRVGKSLVIEFESPEDYEEKGASFGEGAVKFDTDGKFIAASFSAATKDQSAKLKVPRCIRLPNYAAEMDSAPKKDKKTTPSAGHVPIQGQQTQEGDNFGDYTDEGVQKAKTEMAPHILRMQLAVRAGLRIIAEEQVGDKIESQGLTGFLKDISMAIFREPRLEEESPSVKNGDK